MLTFVHNPTSTAWSDLQLYNVTRSNPASLSSQAFWLRSSVVSVLISLKTDMLPQGAIRFHAYFWN